MTYRTNRKTKTRFQANVERKILDMYGIKKLTKRVDVALAMYREQQRNPKPDYLERWRAYTKNFTEAEWDELARRVNIV